MFVAVRVICDSSELCPRRLIKASKGMSMETLLWDGRLWDGVIGDKSVLKAVGINGFNSPLETPESTIKLNWADTVESSVSLGFSFLVFRLTNTNPPTVKVSGTDALGKKDSQGTARGKDDANLATYDKFELIKMRHSAKPGDKNDESKRGIMCACGKELVNIVGYKNHQMWCKLKTGSNSNSSEAPKSRLVCSCGSQFDDQAKYKSHVASCGEAKGQTAVTGKRRRSLSPAQSSNSSDEGEEEGSASDEGEESDGRSGLTCLGCGRTFTRKYNCGVHMKYCRSMVKEEKVKEKLVSRPGEWICECGKVYYRRDRYVHHQESCAIHASDSVKRIPEAEVASRSAINCECGRRFFRHNTFLAHASSCPEHLKAAPALETGPPSVTTTVKSEKLLEGQVRCICGSIFYSHSGLQRHHKTCGAFKAQSAAAGGGEAASGLQDGSPSRQVSRKSMLSDSSQFFNKQDLVKSRVRGTEESSPARTQERAVKELPHGGKDGANKRASDESDEEGDEFEVEMILLHVGSHTNKKSLKFLIRWKGYDAAHDSWLTYAECKELKALDEYCKLHPDLQL
jgi:hypothetical protein